LAGRHAAVMFLGETRRTSAGAIPDRAVVAPAVLVAVGIAVSVAISMAVPVAGLCESRAGESKRSRAREHEKVFHSALESMAARDERSLTEMVTPKEGPPRLRRPFPASSDEPAQRVKASITRSIA